MSGNFIEPEVLEPDARLPADLVALRKLASTLDSAIPIPGTRRRIGLAPIIGLAPGVGDVLSAVISSWIIIGALRHRVPTRILLKMIFNVLLDVCVGAVPVIGDIFDFLFQENLGNVVLLEKHRDASRPPRTHAQVGLVALIVVTFILFVAVVLAIAAIAGFVWLVDSIHASIMGT